MAPEPRDQDFRIDAIVTLLKRDHGHRLVSGSNVFVQLEASSARKIIFAPEDLEWLHRLELPYFIGSVGTADASISLYTVQNAIGLVGAKESSAELCLDPEPGCLNIPVDSEEGFSGCVTNDAGSSEIAKGWLGLPVLAWKLSDAHDVGFHARAVDILEGWVEVSRDNRLLETMGGTLSVSWATGVRPE